MEQAKQVDSKCREQVGGAEKGKFICKAIYIFLITSVNLRLLWAQGPHLHVILTWEGG
jgi:hypothetical protein